MAAKKTPTLNRYEFACKGCKKIEKMASYAIAQLSMGHTVTFTCSCKAKTDLRPSDLPPPR